MNMGKIMLFWESLKGSLKNLPRTNPAPFSECRWCFVRFALNDKKRHTAMYPFSDATLPTILAHCVPKFWSCLANNSCPLFTPVLILPCPQFLPTVYHCVPLFWSFLDNNSCPPGTPVLILPCQQFLPAVHPYPGLVLSCQPLIALKT